MEGRFLDAAHLSQTTSNMPEICGRICPQDRLCEDVCIVGVKHPPVAIGAIEKFINEYAFAHEGLPLPAIARPSGHRVAVVGSGPAGLACAEELTKRGHRCGLRHIAPRRVRVTA
jgi:glutamate synthase (NADPH/NADH) small chain